MSIEDYLSKDYFGDENEYHECYYCTCCECERRDDEASNDKIIAYKEREA